MPQTPHIEQHFTASEAVRDVVIGMSDGLTVPFALAAGLSGAVAASGVVVTAGLAEVSAGAIAMGLGGYLAARTDTEHYASEVAREVAEVQTVPDRERQEVFDLLASYGVDRAASAPVVEALAAQPDQWVQFMMRFELGLEAPDPRRALRSALTIGGAYVAGGLIPLVPYMLVGNLADAFRISVVVTLVALAIFGYIKGGFTGASRWRSAMQTLLIGGIAAAVAFMIARAIG
ncbi:MAG: VIT1/CCC1 transporter family protein [Gemmatimonadaceae bacterium]